VTIDEIAAAADVGPATIYRNFGTKERLVLWDDYDAPLFEAIGAHLATKVSPARAVLDGIVEALAPIYARDRDRLLRRTRMAHDIPEVRAATAADLQQLRTALAELFVHTRALRSAFDAQVQAAAFVGALEVALAHWVRGKGATSLASLVRRAFAALPAAPAARD
jgi:AcrR family transcriptional regulator